MSLNVQELHEKQTRAFIDANPSIVILTRLIKTDDGRGGKVVTGENQLDGQRIRVVGQRRPPARVVVDGREVTVDRSLVGLPTFDVEIGDLFDHNGSTFEVINIQDGSEWRKTAEAIRRG